MPSKMPANRDFYIVICMGDREEGFPRSAYELATRTVFASKEAAVEYAGSIAISREPIIVQGRFHDLRFGEERGGW